MALVRITTRTSIRLDHERGDDDCEFSLRQSVGVAQIAVKLFDDSIAESERLGSWLMLNGASEKSEQFAQPSNDA